MFLCLIQFPIGSSYAMLRLNVLDTNANKPGGQITPKPVTPPPTTSTTEYIPPDLGGIPGVTNGPGKL